MFQSKRTPKSQKSKKRIKSLFILLVALVIFLLVIEYLFLNFSFGKASFLNPIARSTQSKVLNIEKELLANKLSQKNITQNKDGSFNVTLTDGSVVILSSKKDIKSQVSSLQLILSRLTIEGKKLKTLDFRYNNPVISF